MVTKDSVKVLYKMDKMVQLRSIEYLQEVTKIPFSFNELQDILLGQPHLSRDSNIVSYKNEEKGDLPHERGYPLQTFSDGE